MPAGTWRPTRKGQWVKIKLLLPPHIVNRDKIDPECAKLHVTGDGYYLAIHQPPGKDATGEPSPGGLFLVDVNGHNVEYLRKGKVENFVALEAEITEWLPIIDKKDLPPGRYVHPDCVLLP